MENKKNINRLFIRSISVCLSQEAIGLVEFHANALGISNKDMLKRIFKAGGFNGNVIYSRSAHKVTLEIPPPTNDTDSEVFYKYFNDGMAVGV